MTGFAAACYLRGVDFVQVPTTVMAQVDSSVGGKTGVNHELGKNMIGAFYQPQSVVIDTDTLSTLPDRELASGVSEIIKYGLIRDAALFEWLEVHMARLLSRDADALAYAIERSCINKAEVVAQDEKEGGVRATLNLGHTFGHAIETHTGYGSWLHGEAVAAGTAMAADLSHRLGWIDRSIMDRCTYSRALSLAADLHAVVAMPATCLTSTGTSCITLPASLCWLALHTTSLSVCLFHLFEHKGLMFVDTLPYDGENFTPLFLLSCAEQWRFCSSATCRPRHRQT